MAAAVKAASATGGVTLLSCESQKMIICAESNALDATAGGTTRSRSGAATSSGRLRISSAASVRVSSWDSMAACSGTPNKRMAFAGSDNAPAASCVTTNWSLIMPDSAGADNVASTIYAAVTGNPMPRIRLAKAISTSAIRMFPPAQLEIIKLNVFPTPAVAITFTISPTEHNRTAVSTIPLVPMTKASKTAFGPIGFLVSQLDAMTATIPNTAA